MYYFRIVYQRYIILCDICQNIVWTYITEEIYRKHNNVLFMVWIYTICEYPGYHSWEYAGKYLQEARAIYGFVKQMSCMQEDIQM